MPKALLVSELDGTVVDLGDRVKQIEEDDGNIENLEYWMGQNLPDPGTRVRIVVMSFPVEDK